MKNKNLTEYNIFKKENEVLLKVEKDLKKIINQLNEDINLLKVEELQLKANLLCDENEGQDQNIEESKYSILENPEIINIQALDLNIKKSFENKDDAEFESD